MVAVVTLYLVFYIGLKNQLIFYHPIIVIIRAGYGYISKQNILKARLKFPDSIITLNSLVDSS